MAWQPGYPPPPYMVASAPPTAMPMAMAMPPMAMPPMAMGGLRPGPTPPLHPQPNHHFVAASIPMATRLLPMPAGAPVAAHRPVTVYVGNVPHDLHDGHLRNLLEACGGVQSWKRATATMRGGPFALPTAFGYCTFNNAWAAVHAVRALNGHVVAAKDAGALSTAPIAVTADEAVRVLMAELAQVRSPCRCRCHRPRPAPTPP